MENKTRIPAMITAVLLLYFGFVLFLPVVFPNVKFNDPLVQTLINLTIAAVMYYIGTTQNSSKKDDTIAAQLGGNNESGTSKTTGT